MTGETTDTGTGDHRIETMLLQNVQNEKRLALNIFSSNSGLTPPWLQ